MSRSTTYIGLPDSAIKYIGQNAEFKIEKFFNVFNKFCVVQNPITEKIGNTGMFNEMDIQKYKMKDGSWAEEFVQSDEWHSGPVIFMGLRHGDKVFEWTREEIDKRS